MVGWWLKIRGSHLQRHMMLSFIQVHSPFHYILVNLFLARFRTKIFFPRIPSLLGQPTSFMQYFLCLPVISILTPFPRYPLSPFLSSHPSSPPSLPFPPCPLSVKWFSYWLLSKRWAQSKLSELIVCSLSQPFFLQLAFTRPSQTENSFTYAQNNKISYIRWVKWY